MTWLSYVYTWMIAQITGMPKLAACELQKSEIWNLRHGMRWISSLTSRTPLQGVMHLNTDWTVKYNIELGIQHGKFPCWPKWITWCYIGATRVDCAHRTVQSVWVHDFVVHSPRVLLIPIALPHIPHKNSQLQKSPEPCLSKIDSAPS